MDFLIGMIAGIMIITMIVIVYAVKLRTKNKQDTIHRDHVFGLLLTAANHVAKRRYNLAKSLIDSALTYDHYTLKPRHKKLTVLLQSKVDLYKCKEL